MTNNILEASKRFGIQHNVTLRVIDQASGQVVQEHQGHNTATSTMLYGIGHYLTGDGVIRQGYSMLERYVPKYISLGTMGLNSQEEDLLGLPLGIGGQLNLEPYKQRLYDAKKAIQDALAELEANKCCCYKSGCPCWETCQNPEMKEKIKELEQKVKDAIQAYQDILEEAKGVDEETAFTEYIRQRPGFGADGYDMNRNNDRKYAGLGPAFTSFSTTSSYNRGDIVYYKGKAYKATEDIKVNADVGVYNIWDTDSWKLLDDELQPECFELISPSFPRELIAFREVVDERESEIPETVDVVLSAMISTGALAQFRETDKDYIFITEAGLWSRPDYVPDGIQGNGLLAGYRIAPPNEKNWGMKASGILDSVAREYLQLYYDNPDPTDEEIQAIKPEIAANNRDILRRQILKVRRNQVVQVIWKIQIGTIDQFANMYDLRKHYYDINE